MDVVSKPKAVHISISTSPSPQDESALPLSAPLLQPALPRKEHKAPALPSKVPASPVQFKPESARGLSQLVKAEPAATTSTSGAEIPSLVAVKAASQVRKASLRSQYTVLHSVM